VDKELEVVFQARTKEFPTKIVIMVTPPSGDRDRLKEEYDKSVAWEKKEPQQ